MLTAEVERLDPGTPRVHIDVRSVVVRLALSYVSEEHGWDVCAGTHDTCACLRVSDKRCSDPRVDILVVRDTPSECQDALQAVLTGSARAVVLWDEPTALRSAIDALAQHATVIPERVIHLAQAAPRLNDRQRRTLRLVAAGRSNPEISVAFHQSTSTTKRDIAELLTIFDAANRASLTTTAARLGFLPG